MATTDDYEPDRHITEAEYRAWLEHQRPKLAAELSTLLPDWARDAGMRFEWDEADRPITIPIVVDPDQAPGTMTLRSGPNEVTAVNIDPDVPLRMVLPKWPIPRASRCYRLASGAMVHVKPGCRC